MNIEIKVHSEGAVLTFNDSGAETPSERESRSRRVAQEVGQDG